MSELKNCPFCGGDGELSISPDTGNTCYFGCCGDCGCEGPFEPSHNEAAAAWNTRAEASSAEPVAWIFNHRTNNEVFMSLNKARMDPRYWTETPLYSHPPAAPDTVTLDRALVDISEPDMPGAFNGDTWFGHPEKRTLATHRWDGKKWQELPSELDACLRLLAKARDEAKDARTAYVALTQTLIDAERREKQADRAGYERGQRETVERIVAWLRSGASNTMDAGLVAQDIEAEEWK